MECLPQPVMYSRNTNKIVNQGMGGIMLCVLFTEGRYYKHAFVVARENPDVGASFHFNAIKTCSKLSYGGHCTPLLVF